MYFKSLFCFLVQIQSFNFQAFCDSISKHEIFRNGLVCASIRALNSGNETFSYNAEKSVNSASILKLATTAAAIKTLGPDFTFKTEVYYTGAISDGVLKGNLHILGQGDPTLGSQRFKTDFKAKLIDQLKMVGISKIDGHIIGDGSYFSNDLVADSWIWGDIGNYYGAPVAGLNWAENYYTAYFNGGSEVYQPATLFKTEPEILGYEIINDVFTGEKQSGDQSIFYASPYSKRIYLSGTIPLNTKEFKVKGSIPDPVDFATKSIANGLVFSGEALSKTNHANKYGSDFTTKNLLMIWQSPRLFDIAKETNFESINIFADALLKTTAKAAGYGSDFKNASLFLKNYWKSNTGFDPKDGSGLSMAGKVTAASMTFILAQSTEILETIPLLGISGTVKNLAKNTKARGKVRAKSGSIEGTRAYAGYFDTKNGQKMAFCFIVNNYMPGSEKEVRNTLEKMMINLIE